MSATKTAPTTTNKTATAAPKKAAAKNASCAKCRTKIGKGEKLYTCREGHTLCVDHAEVYYPQGRRYCALPNCVAAIVSVKPVR